MVKLSDHDLKQMDAAWVGAQPEGVVRQALGRALEDLRTARDRLNQNPGNSSRPSGSMPPWERTGVAQAIDAQAALAGEQDRSATHRARPDAATDAATPGVDTDAPCEPVAPDAPALAPAPATSTSNAAPAARKKSGRPLGGVGHGRTQQLTPTATQYKHPSHCAACQRPCVLPLAGEAGAHAKAWTGWDSLELEPLSRPEDAVQVLGLRILVTRHLLMAHDCVCGHNTRAQPHRSAVDESWPGVLLSEYRLLGPRLAATIVYLSVRMRLPRRKVQEVLQDLFGLTLSTAVIDQALQQTGRSVEPLEQEIHQALQQAALVHADETSWPEAGLNLWLWVLACNHSVLYFIGRRTKEMLAHALDHDFAGILMSDGYCVYRERARRLRCWAHLLRKLQGLVESCDASAAQAGAAMLAIFKELMHAVDVAREQSQAWHARGAQNGAASASRGLDPPHPPHPRPPCETQCLQVEKLRQLCQHHSRASHGALGAVAREFLRDWEAIMAMLAQPHLPLTNNAAERQLRHWVIARRTSYGTRTPTGSNGFAMLASVIDTCRRRGANIIDTLAKAVHAARLGLAAPAMPPIPPALIAQDRLMAWEWGGV